ncbi:MAG: alpha-glucosidase/alpha-galactosidase [Gammaproteobacteria bacterium]|nr:alpha-glucosidase/alpha-galactosidase [Gammaproteobacteria bacterium]
MSKIAIIGAGSLEFSSRLTADILTYPAPRGLSLRARRRRCRAAQFAGRIVERIFSEGGYDRASYSLHTDRREALPGADFVISSILVGGFEAIEHEIDIPRRYGVCQAIGDTLTPGGIMRCLRTLPHQAGIARDVVELCPAALLLNYTNPMAMLCWGMKALVPEVKLTGLCHSVQGTTGQWAHRLGIPLEEIDFDCAGINHQAWITRFEHRGEDLMPRIRELAVDPERWRRDTSRMEYVKHFGYPVTEAAGHNSEYSPWFRKSEAMVARYCPGGGWNGAPGFIKELYNRPNWRDTMEKMANGKTPVSLERSIEYGSQIVSAVAGGGREVIYGNVMNDSLVDNLPGDACVEVACIADDLGVSPVAFGTLPTHLAAINTNQINVQRLAVAAAIESDPEIVFQAMCLDPLTGAILTLDEIREMTAELLEAHRPWLPEALQDRPLERKPLLYRT